MGIWDVYQLQQLNC